MISYNCVQCAVNSFAQRCSHHSSIFVPVIIYDIETEEMHKLDQMRKKELMTERAK